MPCYLRINFLVGKNNRQNRNVTYKHENWRKQRKKKEREETKERRRKRDDEGEGAAAGGVQAAGVARPRGAGKRERPEGRTPQGAQGAQRGGSGAGLPC